MAQDPGHWCGAETGEGIKVLESFPWGRTSQKFSLSTAPGCAMGEKRNPKKTFLWTGDHFSMLQPLQGLLQKVQVLSLHLRNNKECVGKSGFSGLEALFILSILLSTGSSDLGKGCQVAEPASSSHSQHVLVLSGTSFFKLPLCSLVLY